MSSAHRLTKRKIWVKFNKNRPKGSGDMERARYSRVNPLSLTGDFDLESRWLSHVLCIPSH